MSARATRRRTGRRRHDAEVAVFGRQGLHEEYWARLVS